MITIISIAFFLILYFSVTWILLTRDNPGLFKRAIKKYAKEDLLHLPPPGTFIFTGSSVMKYWKNIKQDLASFPVTNRAIAGTKINEITFWSEELISKYNPAAVILYAGSNDIQGFKPRTAQQVFEGFKSFCANVRKDNSNLAVFFISINPTPSRIRWKHWPVVKKANDLIADYCKKESNLYYIDITEDFLNEDGKPKSAYFKFDKIHLNEKGYAIWSIAVKKQLEAFNRNAAQSVLP